VTQNLPKLTSLTVHGYGFQISCLFAVPSDEFGLQVRLPQTFVFNDMPDCRFHRDAGVTHLRRSHEIFSWKEGLVALPGSLL